MDNMDKRKRLDEEPFHYRVVKDGLVFLYYFGKQVKVLRGKDAAKFLDKINLAGNEKEIQLLMAKVTGNFKRGNERK